MQLIHQTFGCIQLMVWLLGWQRGGLGINPHFYCMLPSLLEQLFPQEICLEILKAIFIN
jgi:hypothetical protein